MPDKARVLTDKKLKALEKRISKAYEEALKDITEEWERYMERGKKRLSRLRLAFLNASDEDKAEAKKAYTDALRNYTLRNAQYDNMVDVITTRLAEVNRIALAYANESLPEIYTLNYNQLSAEATKLGIDYGLEDVLKKRFLEDDIKTPYMYLKKYLDIPKDKRWNTRQLNSSVLQGIIQGESMDEIAKRILPIVDNNRKAAIRNARTMVTGAENVGRLDGYKRLESQGAVLKKVWIATADSRTRDAHLALDGQEVDIDEDFVDGNGDTLRYPGDPQAHPRTVYNCRCSMGTHIIGIRMSNGRIRYISGDSGSDFHRGQIAKEKASRR